MHDIMINIFTLSKSVTVYRMKARY